MKTINSRQMAAIKRVAQTVNPLLARRMKLEAQLYKISEEVEAINEEIDAHEAGVKAMTGKSTEELVKKVTDENKVSKYIPNEENVTYNEETKTYEIKDDILADPDEIHEKNIIDTPIENNENNEENI